MVWLPHTYLRPGIVRRSLDPQLRRLGVSRLWTALATLVDVRHRLRRLDLMQQTVEKLRDTITPRRRQTCETSAEVDRIGQKTERQKARRPEGKA